jgi:hydrogenase maturation protein HypF
VVAYDLHPDYLSTRYAMEQDKPLIGIQHHHAHIASCMAENGLDGKVIGVACDGTGYGTDGNIWGCEFLIADYCGFQRYAHLEYVPLPGGDSAVKEPYRMAISYLYHVFSEGMLDLNIPLLKRIDEKKIRTIIRMIESKVNSPYTSSSGRLFDAVSSIIGIRDTITYEAQAAIELEMMAQTDIKDRYTFTLQKNCLPNGGRCFDISVKDMIIEIVDEVKHNVPQPIISAKFHNTLAEMISSICEKISNESKINRVVLSGGTFQNMYLLGKVLESLENRELELYIHKQVPSNDGGISLGQAVIGSKSIITA